MEKSKLVNYHGWKVYQDYANGYGPYFLNTIMERIHQKKAVNTVVTGEAGEGKSYMACDICRVVMGYGKFSLEQVVFTYNSFMDLIVKLPAGYPIVFDEPSYAIGKRDWYKTLNKILVLTIESKRFKRHPVFFPIINKSLLDKTIRSHLLQFQVNVIDRGKASVYRIRASQFVEKVYHKWFCDLEYSLFDNDKCNRDSCLDCSQLMSCNLFRACYERKKASIQDARYLQAREVSEREEIKRYSMQQLENLAYAIREKYILKGKLDVAELRIVMEDDYGVRLSQSKAYELRKRLLRHYENILDV